jgi:hypothetical protein
MARTDWTKVRQAHHKREIEKQKKIEEMEKKAEEKPAAKSTEEKKPETKKPAAKSIEEKKQAAKNTEAKKPEKKTPAEKKSAVPTFDTFLEYNGVQFDVTPEKLKSRVEEAYKAEGHRPGSIKSMQVYLNLDEGRAYYVINGKSEDKFIEL